MNRRAAAAILALSVLMSACMPGLAPLSAVDAQNTSIAAAGTIAAQTMAARPTFTSLPTNTPLPTATEIPATPTATETPLPTFTATDTPAATGTGTAATGTTTAAATGATATLTLTPTATRTGTVTPTLTFTPGPLAYGTVPPNVPYGFVTLVNLSAQMAYISFHCAMNNGLTTIMEFPVYGKLKTQIPAGFCHYVAYVRGQEFKGDFRIHKYEEFTFTFKRNKIVISQP